LGVRARTSRITNGCLPDAWGMTPDSAYKGAKAYVASKQHPPDTAGLRVVRKLEVLRQPNLWKALLTAPEGKCGRVWDHPNATVTRAVLERSYGPKELAAFDRLDRAGWIAKARRCEIMPYRISESYWADILGIVPRKRPMVERLWQVSNETLLEMASMAKAARVPLLVVGFPTAFSADPAASRRSPPGVPPPCSIVCVLPQGAAPRRARPQGSPPRNGAWSDKSSILRPSRLRRSPRRSSRRSPPRGSARVLFCASRGVPRSTKRQVDHVPIG
jgi:hypothetical protein